ncbi:MAG TPA: NAD(P)/FAD-dependent oxidoreductase [Dissulfurispiraceae bacterium]|nr:NAD(P)/FAD-dependent oxidoreductase [Dissulfurispiraceae bacterium]
MQIIQKDVVIIGAGASGLMCAIEAGKRGRRVLILDHAGRLAQKVRVSGGGRCNFTNLDVRAEHYYSSNPHFCKSALARYVPDDFMAFLRKHKIAFAEKEAGQLFCLRSSSLVVHALQKECMKFAADILLGHPVKSIARPETFEVTTKDATYRAESLVIATGGLSYPALGATDFGLRVARQFGLNVVPLTPALVPLLFSGQDAKRFAGLSGISLDVVVTCLNCRFRGNLLFTHKGLSGPSVLQISTVWRAGEEIAVNLLPDSDILDVLMKHHRNAIELHNLIAWFLPKRFSQVWCKAHAPSRPLNTYTDKELKSIAGMLHEWTIMPAGTEGYIKAEVTAGGVDTAELSSKTMEAKKIPGLYFIGEVVDVTGQLGGYNLHWAWASGFAAGQVA